SLRISADKSLSRFNIRTTDDKPENVKKAILDAFGPTLARVEMTYNAVESKRIAATPPAADADAVPDRFAGGWEHGLRFNTTAFNSTQSPAQVVGAEFVKVLTQAGIANPDSRFEIKDAPAPAGSAEAPAAAMTGTHLILRSDLEPDV